MVLYASLSTLPMGTAELDECRVTGYDPRLHSDLVAKAWVPTFLLTMLSCWTKSFPCIFSSILIFAQGLMTTITQRLLTTNHVVCKCGLKSGPGKHEFFLQSP